MTANYLGVIEHMLQFMNTENVTFLSVIQQYTTKIPD